MVERAWYSTAPAMELAVILEGCFSLGGVRRRQGGMELLDSPDLRLHADGCRLLLCGRVLNWYSASGSQRRARQSRRPGMSREIDNLQLQQRIARRVAPRCLEIHASGHWQQWRWLVLDALRKPLATLTLDALKWKEAGLNYCHICLRGAGEVVSSLEKGLCKRLPPLTGGDPLQQWLQQRWQAQQPPPIDLQPGQAALSGLCSVLMREQWVMAHRLPGVLANSDPEFLHEYRVALRRTRALWRELGDWPPSYVQHYFSGEWRWLGRLTSTMRDADVTLLTWDKLEADVSAALAPARQLLERQRAAALGQLHRAVTGRRYVHLQQQWAIWLESAAERPDLPVVARQPLQQAVLGRIERLAARLHKQLEALSDRDEGGAWHRLRIRIKRLRYLLEAFGPVLPEKALSRLLPILKSAQDTLGQHQDATAEITLLSQLAGDPRMQDETGVVLAVGRLMERAVLRQQRLRNEFGGVRRQLLAKPVRKAFRRLAAGIL